MSPFSIFRRRGWRSALALVLAMVVVDLNVERIGDRLQIALPIAGLACAIGTGNAVPYFGRYVGLEVMIKGPKALLGALEINQRPNGGLSGFPSGHTAVATFGAAGLAKTCLAQSKQGQVVVYLAAAYVGGSRVESDKHYLFQTIAGALLGLGMQFLALRWLDRLSCAVAGRIRRAWMRGKATVMAFLR